MRVAFDITSKCLNAKRAYTHICMHMPILIIASDETVKLVGVCRLKEKVHTCTNIRHRAPWHEVGVLEGRTEGPSASTTLRNPA